MKFFEFKENKVRGTANFPIELYHINKEHPRYEMPYHWHIGAEIIRVLEGSIEFLIDNEKVFAQKGDIIFIHDGQIHGGIPKDCIYECLVFDMNMLMKRNSACTKQIKDILTHKNLIQTKLPTNAPMLSTIVNSLFEEVKANGQGKELLIVAQLFYFFGLVIKYELYQSSEDVNINKKMEKLDLFRNVLLYIENNYGNYVSLDDLAKVAGMNPKYFCKFFYEMIGRTPIDYLNFYRIESAAEQLITTDETITEIGMNCGFNDLSYFTKTFKKYKNRSPKQHRESCRAVDSMCAS